MIYLVWLTVQLRIQFSWWLLLVLCWWHNWLWHLMNFLLVCVWHTSSKLEMKTIWLQIFLGVILQFFCWNTIEFFFRNISWGVSLCLVWLQCPPHYLYRIFFNIWYVNGIFEYTLLHKSWGNTFFRYGCFPRTITQFLSLPIVCMWHC